jgi:ankyrin repeat protein
MPDGKTPSSIAHDDHSSDGQVSDDSSRLSLSDMPAATPTASDNKVSLTSTRNTGIPKKICNFKKLYLDLLNAIEFERTREIEQIIQSLAIYAQNPFQYFPKEMAPIMHLARSLEMINILKKHGANIDAQDIDGRTALHKAVLEDNAYLAMNLLSAGANKNIPDIACALPYHYIKPDTHWAWDCLAVTLP